jgi:hypothetical protein
MQVIDEITRNKVGYGNCKRVIVGYAENGDIIYGYTRQWKEKCLRVRAFDRNGRSDDVYMLNTDELRKNLFYSNQNGVWMSKVNMPEDIYIREAFRLGQNKFPYNFERRYEAVESFNIFKNKQEVLEMKQYPLGEFLRYTFGLEFETSAGLIPENICIRDGLIPLRDGSISGLEYSTVVLDGNAGLSLLEQQINTLKQYTVFNKECSLHIHLGGYPLEPKALHRLYTLCRNLQNDIVNYVPELTFNTAQYKASGKDYCKLLPDFPTFEELYRGLVGRNFFGDLTQPHPADPDRHHKWNIHTRYFWLNLMNMLCYNVNKTVEFRLLRPTYNFRKITLWLYIMNAILRYAEDPNNPVNRAPEQPMEMKKLDPGNPEMYSFFERMARRSRPSYITIQDILNTVYPKEIADKLRLELVKLEVVTSNQRNSGDRIGAALEIEEMLFNSNEIL